MGEEQSRFFLVRLRKKHPMLFWTLTIIVTVAAFIVSIPLTLILGSLSGVGLVILSLFLACLWLGVKLGYVKWNE